MKEKVEEKTAAALAQKHYTVILGGKKFKFFPVSLSDREEISVLAAEIRTAVSGGEPTDAELLAEAIRCGQYGRRIAGIIATGAHVRGFGAAIRRWRIFHAAYRHACIEELILCASSLFDHMNPAFFLNIIISLNRQNMLEQTKETKATARG